MIQPSNQAYLAAELMAAQIPKYYPNPNAAAGLATMLCRLGRTYFRLSERLCGGEEEWGAHPRAQALIERCEARRSRLHDTMVKHCKAAPFRVTLESDGAGLGLVAITTRKSGARTFTERTALR
jgi:hypothetical protein